MVSGVVSKFSWCSPGVVRSAIPPLSLQLSSAHDAPCAPAPGRGIFLNGIKVLRVQLVFEPPWSSRR